MSLRDCCDAARPLGTESRTKPNQNNGREGILTPEPTVGLLDLEQLTDEAMGEGNLTRPEIKVGFDEQTPSFVKTDELTNLLKRSGEQSAYSECIAMKQFVGADGQVVFTNLSKSGEDLMKSDSSQTDLTNLMKSDCSTDGQSAYSHSIQQGKGRVSGGQLAFAEFLKQAEHDDALSGCPLLMKSGGTTPIPTLKMEDTSSIPNLKMEATSSISNLKMEEACPMLHHPKLSIDHDDEDDDDCPPAPTLELVLVDPMCLDCPSDDGGPPALDRLESRSPGARLESEDGGPPPLDQLESRSPGARLEGHVC
uniref:Uncharacterized protein n=1 Tax=Cacopsylla melanoneura TaxID=428564 RepID=A0A8D8YB74_9HEMI